MEAPTPRRIPNLAHALIFVAFTGTLLLTLQLLLFDCFVLPYTPTISLEFLVLLYLAHETFSDLQSRHGRRR